MTKFTKFSSLKIKKTSGHPEKAPLRIGADPLNLVLSRRRLIATYNILLHDEDLVAHFIGGFVKVNGLFACSETRDGLSSRYQTEKPISPVQGTTTARREPQRRNKPEKSAATNRPR